MPKIIFNKFTGQIPTEISNDELGITGPPGSFLTSQNIDTIRNPGRISPSFNTTDLTNINVVDNLITKFQLYDTAASIIYGLEDRSGNSDSNIQQITVSTNTITTTAFHTIAAAGATHNGGTAHTTFAGEDMISYQIGGDDYFIYTYNDNTDGGMGRFTVTGGTPDDDYLTTVLSASALSKDFPHPIIEGENGFAYIADGNTLHKLDGLIGANGTFTASAIDLPKGYIITQMVNWRGFMFILAHKRLATSQLIETDKRRVSVFIWNYLSIQGGNETGFDAIIALDDDTFAGKITLHNGVPHVFTVGGGSITKLKKWNGATFVTLPFGEFRGRSEYPNVYGGMEHYGNHLIWGTKDGRLRAFGSNIAGGEELGNDLMLLGGVVTGAIIRIGASGAFYISHENSSNYKIIRTSGYTTDTATLNTLWKELPYMSEVKRLNVLYPPFASSQSSTLAIEIRKNLSSTVEATKTMIHSADSSRGWYSTLLDIKNVHAIQLRLIYTIGGTDNANSLAITPYRIELEYEPTNKTH